MSEFVISEKQKLEHELMYDLIAVSNHFGSLSFGHYTAYAKNHETCKWYDYNDSNVSEVDSISSLCTGSAYVLYYQRKDLVNSGGINFDSIKIGDAVLQAESTTSSPDQNMISSSLSKENSTPIIEAAEIAV